MKKALVYVGILLLLLVSAGAAFVVSKPSKREPTNEVVERTPARLERGKYLVESVLMCLECHSDRQLNRFGFPFVEQGKGSGGKVCWDEAMGLHGFRLCAPNITPDPETGLGNWTDGEIMRAVREGVNKSGKALFPVMPYTEYRSLSDEDMNSVVAYLRTIPAVANKVPERILPGPLPIIVRFMPKTLSGPVEEPNKADPKAYGEYLATVGGCRSCHTPVDSKHQPLPGMAFAGGQEFQIPGGPLVASANLTPDSTGLGRRTKAEFVGLIRSFSGLADIDVPLEQNTVMPYLTIHKMKDEDLGAIYTYLQSLAPIAHSVVRRPHPAVPAPVAPETDAGADALPVTP
jgi:cytochrome c553